MNYSSPEQLAVHTSYTGWYLVVEPKKPGPLLSLLLPL